MRDGQAGQGHPPWRGGGPEAGCLGELHLIKGKPCGEEEGVVVGSP